MVSCPYCDMEIGYLKGRLYCPDCGWVESDEGTTEIRVDTEKKIKDGGYIS